MTSLVKLTDQLLVFNNQLNMRYVNLNVYYPTQASYKFPDGTIIGKCARSVWLEKMEVPGAALDARTFRIFDFGNIFELHEIDNYKKLGIYVADHVKFGFPFANELVVSGEVDTIVKVDGKLVGVEMKTSYGNSFMHQHITGYKRRGNAVQPHTVNPLQSAPKAEHLLQAGIYLYFFQNIANKKYGINLDEFRFIYMARDMLIAAEYVLTLEKVGNMHRINASKLYSTYDESEYEEVIMLKDIFIEPVLDRFAEIHNYVKANVVPPADYDFSAKENGKSEDWQCEYCKYKHLCEVIGKGEVNGKDVYDIAEQLGGV